MRVGNYNYNLQVIKKKRDLSTVEVGPVHLCVMAAVSESF